MSIELVSTIKIKCQGARENNKPALLPDNKVDVVVQSFIDGSSRPLCIYSKLENEEGRCYASSNGVGRCPFYNSRKS